MCTVTYLPHKTSGFILTSSRDEAFNRPAAKFPFEKSIGTHGQVVYPLDPAGNGSWIASSIYSSVCLLNGALVKHKHEPPYKHSRGLVVTDFYKYADHKDFYSQYSFDGIEPFTLLMLEHKKNLLLNVLVWDGSKKMLQQIDPNKPNIWSSVTLYTDEIIAQRRKWFNAWYNSTENRSADNIRKFHHFGGTGDPENSIRMQRGTELGSVSITSIERNEQNHNMVYEDLTAAQIEMFVLDDPRSVRKNTNENA